MSATGTYYIFIELVADGNIPGNAYTVDVTTTGAVGTPAWLMHPRAHDGGGDLHRSGQHLRVGVLHGRRRLVPVLPTVGDVITVDVLHPFLDGNIDATLHDTTGAVQSASSLTDDETLNWTVANGGTHYVEVVMTNDTGTTPGNTTRSAWRSRPPRAAPVRPTPTSNNSQGSTVAVTTPFNEPSLHACPDEDWFDFNGSGDTITVTATFAHAEGDLTVTLVDAGGNTVVSGNSTTDNETITMWRRARR